MIRIMTEQDLEDVYGLIRELEGEGPDRAVFADIFKDILEDPRHICFVSAVGGQVIGVIHLRREAQLHHGARVGEILELCVAGAYRSKGVGRALFEIGREWAKDNGCVLLEVTCNLSREGAHAFYAAQGMGKTHYKFSMSL